MCAFKVTEDAVRKVSITPPPAGWMSPRRLSPIPRIVQGPEAGQLWSNLAGIDDKQDTFKVDLNVRNFNSHDLSVKSIGNRLIIEGKQIEKQPNSKTYVSRDFNLSYVLPQDVDVDEMRSSISEQGILTIQAPKVPSPRPSPMNKRKN